MPEFGLLGYRNDEPKPSLLQVLEGSIPATNPPVTVKNPVSGGYAYSSLGYVALQQYINDATGRPFNVLASEKVFEPLRMHDSLYAQSLPPTLATRAAFGHELDGTVVAGNWREYPELAPSGLWSTAHDLALFAVAVQRAASGLDSRLITQQQARTMLTPVRDSYGLGFELDHTGAEPVFHHSGSNAGYKSLLFAYERTGKGVVILTNSDNGWILIEEIARSIAAEYAWDDYRPMERVSVKANTALFSRFSGDFAVSNTTLRISHDSSHLYIAGPPIGPLPVELISAGDYDYFIREKDVTLHFDSNGSDKIQTLTFIDGRPRKGTRLAQSAPHAN
jgi:CubicO group peptidase (beta-lactamase class C family)